MRGPYHGDGRAIGKQPIDDKGYVLIWTLGAIALLSWLAAVIAAASQKQLVDRSDDLVELQMLAAMSQSEAEIKARLFRPLSEPLTLPADGTTSAGPITVLWQIDLEATRFDINKASPAAMSVFLRDFVSDDDTAARLADAIADWRDEDDLRHLNGAEANEYRLAKRVGPANAPLRDVSELVNVLGFTPELVACIADQLTVFGSALGDRTAPSPTARYVPRSGDAIRVTSYATDSMSKRSRSEVTVYRLTGNEADPIWLLNSAVSTAVPAPSCKEHGRQL